VALTKGAVAPLSSSMAGYVLLPVDWATSSKQRLCNCKTPRSNGQNNGKADLGGSLAHHFHIEKLITDCKAETSRIGDRDK
jgi:hypothetical protein